MENIFLIGIIVTLIAGIESLPVYPLSPFIIVHALLAIVVPLAHPALKLSLRGAKRLVLKGLAGGMIYAALFSGGIGYFLKLLNLDREPSWNLLLLYRHIYQGLSSLNGTLATDLTLFIFIVLWAGIVEELFYRGFIFGGLRRKYGFIRSLLASSALFGLRHSLQLLYFFPHYPLPAGVIYFLFSFGAGCLLAYLLESSGSLFMAMAVHSGINLLGFPILLYIFKTNG